MTPQAIHEVLAAHFPEARHLAVTGEGGKYTVTLVLDQFEGQRALLRQQAIYAPLQAHIASGAIHAVTMRAHSPEEWRKISLFG